MALMALPRKDLGDLKKDEENPSEDKFRGRSDVQSKCGSEGTGFGP